MFGISIQAISNRGRGAMAYTELGSRIYDYESAIINKDPSS